MNSKIMIFHNIDKNEIKIIFEDRQAGYLTYSIHDNALDIEHTVVDPAFRGQGLGHILVEKAIEHAEEEGLIVIPSCSYAERVMKESQ
jgi:Predicted acetyltransferase